MRIVSGLSVLMVVLLAAAVQADDEKEKKISVSECPKAVQKTLQREAGEGKIAEVEVEQEGRQTVYEAEVCVGDHEYEIEVRADGTLLSKALEGHEEEDEDEGDDDDEEEVETPVKLSDLPKAVQRTLKREARGGEIEEIVKEQEGDKIVFEAEVEYETDSGELEYEIEIAEDGTLLSKSLEEEDDEEDGDEDDDEDEDEEDED